MFKGISADDLSRALGALVSPQDGLGHVAIGGKRLRGASTNLSRRPMLSRPAGNGEVIEALELIKSLPLEGAVVTEDAGFYLQADCGDDPSARQRLFHL